MGLGIHGQCAGGRGGDHRRRAVRPDIARPCRTAAWTSRPDPVLDRHHRPGLHRHRGAKLGMAQRAHRRGFRASSVVVLAVFALWERRTPHPMLDVSVFVNRRFSGGSLAVTAGFLTLFGFIFVITQYFQFIKGYSAFETGVRLLPVAISIAVASIVGPRIVERIGTTAVVVGGLVHVRGGACVGIDRRCRYAVHPNRVADGASRRRPRVDHRACHRIDHGLAVRGQGRGRLGRQ